MAFGLLHVPLMVFVSIPAVVFVLQSNIPADTSPVLDVCGGVLMTAVLKTGIELTTRYAEYAHSLHSPSSLTAPTPSVLSELTLSALGG